jgi:hypothetical protein
MPEQLQDVPSFNPQACAVLLVLGYLTWSLPRRLAICPLLIMMCLMPLGQELVLFGLHFFLFRILLLVGVLRVLTKGECRQFVWTRMDKTFVWWGVASVVFGTMADPSADLLRNRLGEVYNAVACYFFIRCVIVDFDDILVTARALAWLSLPVVACMLAEKVTGHNVFHIFGGVPDEATMRDGHVRCQGAFRHPILAGTFWAVQVSLFAALWVNQTRFRKLATAAILSSIGIAVTASSGGALTALGTTVIGLALWKWRAQMRLFRWGAILTVISLALVMKAPVWYLIDRLSSVTGGTGWHRSYLIGQAVTHFDEWWLCGTTYTAHWAPSPDQVFVDEPNMMDITNHYIMEGVRGGLLKLTLFVLIIIQGFKGVGLRLRAMGLEPRAGFLVWALGVSLFTHCFSFLSIHYFDQTILIWYWLLATISGVAYAAKEQSLPDGSHVYGSPASA